MGPGQGRIRVIGGERGPLARGLRGEVQAVTVCATGKPSALGNTQLKEASHGGLFIEEFAIK